MVSVGLQGQRTVITTADATGTWSVDLIARKGDTDLPLTVRSGAAIIVLEDGSAGDVFLCSGQSKMEFPLRLATDADNALASAD